MREYVPTPLRPLLGRCWRFGRKWRRILSLLYKNGELQRTSYYVMDDRKLVFISVPKAACTSIKIAMARSYGIEVDQAKLIHYDRVWQSWYGSPASLRDDFAIFAFVRNPYARLVSCYLDKVCNLANNHPKPYMSHLCSKLYPYHLSEQMSFAEFVTRVARIPDRLADRHFKSQASFLLYEGRILPDFVGRVENLAHDWAQIATQYNFSPQISHKNKSPYTTDYRAYYTPELADIVYKRYVQDFKLFGYSQQLEA